MIKDKTILIDLDGTLLFHEEDFLDSISKENLPVLNGVVEKLCRWHCKGYTIVITTARAESLRELTKRQLAAHNIIYDQLVMGVGSGVRYVINDIDPKYPNQMKAVAINISRNEGLENIELN